MGRFGSVFAMAGVVVLATLVAQTAQAAAYRYVDDRGVVHFTDRPDDKRWKWIPTERNEFIAHSAYRKRVKLPAGDRYDKLILRSARNHRVEPALVKAVIAAESNFQPTAVSRVGAQGLMQLMPKTAEQLGVDNPFHPAENVDGGTRYLRDMLDRYGDLKHALAAYNAGPTAVDRFQGIPPYPETLDYVSKVLDYYHGYHAEFRRRVPRIGPSSTGQARRSP
jgi:soluble lytic murein transglycosylase-like protein